MTKALLLAAAKTICLRPSDSHRLKHSEQFLVSELKNGNSANLQPRINARKQARKRARNVSSK